MIVLFTTLIEALRAGFQVEEITQSGYIVKTMTPHGWAHGLVRVKR